LEKKNHVFERVIFFDFTNSQDQKKIPWKKKDNFNGLYIFSRSSFFGLLNFQDRKMKSLKKKKNVEKWIKMISKAMKRKKTH
jgi:hypothetical protein